MTTKKGAAPIKAGKKSIEEKYKSMGFTGSAPGEVNPLDLDPELQAELDSFNLKARWINFREYRRKGMHHLHFVPYKRESDPVGRVVYNKNPDGYTVNGDLVLAAKPNDWHNQHKKALKKKADRISNPQALKAEEMREFSRHSGLKTSISEGYGEESD